VRIVAVAGHSAGGYGLIDPRQVLGGQTNIERPEGLAQAIAAAGADQGHDVTTPRQRPGEGELRGRRTLVGRDGGQGVDQCEVPGEVLALEPLGSTLTFVLIRL
jgi:hypothetical protein